MYYVQYKKRVTPITIIRYLICTLSSAHYNLQSPDTISSALSFPLYRILSLFIMLSIFKLSACFLACFLLVSAQPPSGDIYAREVDTPVLETREAILKALETEHNALMARHYYEKRGILVGVCRIRCF